MVDVNSDAFRAACEVGKNHLHFGTCGDEALNRAFAAFYTAYEAAKPSDEGLIAKKDAYISQLECMISNIITAFDSRRNEPLEIVIEAVRKTVYWQPLPEPPVDTAAPHDNVTP